MTLWYTETIKLDRNSYSRDDKQHNLDQPFLEVDNSLIKNSLSEEQKYFWLFYFGVFEYLQEDILYF